MNNNSNNIVSGANPDGIDRCNCLKCQGRAGTARVCFNSRKLAARATAKTAGLFLLLASFFLQGRATAGVVPSASTKAAFGYLQVFSTTQEAQWGEGSFYYPHTGYRIYDAKGRTVKWVNNHDTSTDEVPQKIELAPGVYIVWAQSDRAGYVKIPVVVRLAQTTAVHLENDRARDTKAINPARAVTTSNGQIVGWKA